MEQLLHLSTKERECLNLHEENLRFLMSVVVVIAAVLGGVLSVLAAREEQSSLWYSVAVFAGATALSELSYVMAGIYLVVFAVLVMRNRKWKMTAT